MTGLDTNVLVRYLAQDDPRQSTSATRFIEAGLSERTPGFISLVALVELCWVLERLYGATPIEIGQTVNDLLETPRFALQHRDVVQQALQQFHVKAASKAGFADLLITRIAMNEGCSAVVSFDRAAVRGAGMALLD